MSFSLALVKQKYTPFGGAEKVINEALACLHSHGDVDVSIIAREWTLPPLQLRSERVRFVRCDPFYIGRAMRARTFARAVHKKLQDYDLVQAHEPLPGAHIYRAGSGLHAKWLEQLAFELSLSEKGRLLCEPKHRVIVGLEAQMFSDSSLKAVIANSQMVVDDIHDLYPDYRKDQVKLIWNGVNHQDYNPDRRLKHRSSCRDKLSLPLDAKVLLMLGTGWHRKGAYTALRLLAFLPKSVYLILAGKESHIQRFKNMADSLSIDKDRIRWVGATSKPFQLLAAADLFIQPSMYDQMPNASLEAMACGLPVVVSKTSGTKGLVNDGVEGFVREWFSPTDWIEPVLNALQRSEEMGYAAHQRVLPLTFQRMVEEWLGLYRSLLSH